MGRSRAWLVLCLVHGGCSTDLGTCDESSARDVVYVHSLSPDRDGLPAYAGQALLQRSCGDGAFCHAEDPVDSFGTPLGLTLDIRLACPDPDRCAEDERERQQRAREVVVALAAEVFSMTESGAMPPGEAGAGVVSVGPRFRRQPARSEAAPQLPPARSEEGLAILRNWLACGAPVVARTMPESADAAPGDRCADLAGMGDCVVRAGTGASP